MDKIYTRKRIVLPKIYYNRFSNNKEDRRKRTMLKISVVLIIAICMMVWIISGISPIIDKLCVNASKSKATLISNEKASEVMVDYEYEDMVTLYTDDEGNITMIKSNTSVINKITSDVAVKIQEEFANNREEVAYLRMRKFSRK